MRILYLGLPLGAAVLASHGFTPVVIGLGHVDTVGMARLRRRCRGSLLLGKPDLDDSSLQKVLASARPDVLLSFFYPKRIPEAVLALPRHGAYGTHPSLLPRHRGPDPYFWTLRCRDAHTGVTLHALERDYDTGGIVTHRSLAVSAEHDSWTLARALDRPALALLVEAARRVEAEGRLPTTPQDAALATHAPDPSEDDTSLDFHAPTDEVLALVRACAPTPGALAEVEDATVEIVRASRYVGPVPGGLTPAEAFLVGDRVAVRTSDGAVRLDVVRDEDGRPMDLAAYVRARHEARG